MKKKLKRFFSDNTGLVIRLDDIAEKMNWYLMEKCEKLFLSYNIKPLLGVIPNNQDKEFDKFSKNDKFWKKIREWKKIGWEISMHGYSHVYDSETNKKDYFNYGGRSEFFGHNYNTQFNKIKKGTQKFKDEGINVRSFFAPNHTYDKNTFLALKNSGIKYVIDGYGLIPYSEYGLDFIPQLFYKEIMLPFGIQSTQIHLNYWSNTDYENFEIFIKNNYSKIISFDDAITKINNSFLSKTINFITKKSLKTVRSIRLK